MRKIIPAALFALAAILAAGTTKLISAQYRVKVPPRQTVRTTATFTSLVYGAPPSYLWIMIKWGPGKDDFIHAQVLPATRILENGRPAPKSALCPTPTGPNCGSVSVRVTGYYYGALNLGTNFSATEIVILSAAPARSAGPPPPSSGYHPPAYTGSHPPAAATNPPAAQTGQAPPAGQTSLTGTIQAVRPGYFELTAPGRSPLWVREFGARIEQNGRSIGANSLRVAQSVQVRGQMVGAQLWASEVLVVPSRQATGGAGPAGQPPASASGSQQQSAPMQLTAQQKAQLARRKAAEEAKLEELEKLARQKFLAYKATFQMQQVDREVGLLNSLVKNPACGTGCEAAVQASLAADNRVKLNLGQTKKPLENVYTYLYHVPPPNEAPNGLITIKGGGAAPPGGLGGGGNSCTAPQITSMSVSAAQPGDPVLINGSGFTNAPNTAMTPSVNLIMNGQTFAMGVADSTDSQILVYVPTIAGVQSTQAYISVQTCQQSGIVPFQFNPEIAIGQLPIALTDVSWGDFTCGIDSCSSVHAINADGSVTDLINGGTLTGRRGDDQFFYGYQLKNGWQLDSVSFSTPPPDPHNGCSVSDTPGSASPYVDVHCWVSPLWSDIYSLSIYIHGPTGVAYQ